VVVLLAITCIALAAGPALAQKDPFDPVIDPNAPATTTGGTSTGTTGTTIVQPSVGSEGLANTGFDLRPWLALAYTLILIGGGTLYLSRQAKPHPIRR
jgi:drug/metabolite transporter (DMT)-like permease